jgi:hypothetical protein
VARSRCAALSGGRGEDLHIVSADHFPQLASVEPGDGEEVQWVPWPVFLDDAEPAADPSADVCPGWWGCDGGVGAWCWSVVHELGPETGNQNSWTSQLW